MDRKNVVPAVMPSITPLCFWHGGFQPPIPDAKYPGKAWEYSAGESKLSPSDFPRLSWARSLQTFPNLSVTRGTNIAIPTMYLRAVWVQGGHRPGAEFEAAQASTFPLLVFNLIFILENKLVNTVLEFTGFSAAPFSSAAEFPSLYHAQLFLPKIPIPSSAPPEYDFAYPRLFDNRL